MAESPIVVEHIYKQYNLKPEFEIRRLLQSLLDFWKHTQRDEPQYRDALVDVSFSLKQGESLGIIGENGAGKTTLLRLLAGVSLPTKGRIRVAGEVSSLSVLGAGFHPNLTGRENLYMTCSLSGMNRHDAFQHVEQMIAFSELEDSIDVAFKRYSSGMKARLTFAAIITLNPEIVLIDEVLAVGDYRFQVKSLAALREFIEDGTLVFVSHNLQAVERICERVIWLEKGSIRMDGLAPDVIAAYTSEQQQILIQQGDAQQDNFPKIPSQETDLTSDGLRVDQQILDNAVLIHSVAIHNQEGQPCVEFSVGDTIVVRCHLLIKKPTKNIHVAIGLRDIEKQVIVTACNNQGIDAPEYLVDHTVIECRFPNIMLRPREYGLHIELSNAVVKMPLHIWTDLDARFSITDHQISDTIDLVHIPGTAMRYLAINQSSFLEM